MLRHKDRPPPSPSYMSDDQMGQPFPPSPSTQAYSPTKSSRLRESFSAADEDSQCVPAASYLKDLRANKTRPIGSRPPPPSKFGSLRRTETDTTRDAPSAESRPTLPQSSSMPILPPQTMTNERPKSSLGFDNAHTGRPLARPPSANSENKGLEPLPEKPVLRRPNSAVYLEQGSRWMEKQEARSLRKALEDMDLAEEQRVHSDAQDEAAELVWKHRNFNAPGVSKDAPFENPDFKRDYRSHLEKGSYVREHSQEGMQRVGSRNSFSSRSSQRPSLDHFGPRSSTSIESASKVEQQSAPVSDQKPRRTSGKGYGDLAAAVKKDIDTARRRTSSGGRRILSSEKKFMHPDDRIYEDPQEEPTPPKKQPPPQPIPDLRRSPPPAPAQNVSMRKNPFARVRMQQERFERTQSAPQLQHAAPKHDRVEIQRNPPSQSRNPWYMSNEPLPPTPPRPESVAEDEVSPKGTPTKDGREIRGDDIRSATSKQRKDRSPNLPQPTMVSGKLGRPIVSFDAQKPKEIVMEEAQSSRPSSSSGVAGPWSPTKSDTTHAPIASSSTTAGPSNPTKSATSSPRPSPFLRHSVPRFEPPKMNINAPKPPVPTISLPDEPAAPKSQAPPNGFPPETSGPRPPIPTINLPDDEPSVPSIVLPEEPDFASTSSGPPTPSFRSTAPTISVNGPGFSTRPSLHHAATTANAVPHASRRPSTNHQHQQEHHHQYQSQPPRHHQHRPLPTPTQAPAHHSRTAPLPARPKSTPHFTPSPSLRQSSALCDACALPITGRVLSASGSRFHPSCFTCHICSTNLELVAFYPEPQSAREARLNPDPNSYDGEYGSGADADPSPHFYCHLDYHETFSPRCKTCTTPIESEIILACGAAYHSGHFFCAQCGDPFDKSTPFVEKEGYAWCVGCHTNRYSTKCKGCRKPVTDTVVKALGAEWHETCFVCVECGGEFEDGRYFLRGEEGMPVCVGCEERRLKA